MDSTPLHRTLASTRSSLVSDCRYEVTLDLTGGADARQFRSQTLVTFQAARAAATVVDVAAESYYACQLNGAGIEPPGSGPAGQFPVTLRRGANEFFVDAAFDYAARPAGLHRSVDAADGSRYIWGNFEPDYAHRVFPCFDQPDVKGRFRLHVLTPPHWTCVTSGATLLVSPATGEDGRPAARWEFAETPPIPPYIVGIVAGPLREETADWRVPLSLYHPASLSGQFDIAELFALTRDGLSFYENEFGHPYPFAKLALCFVPGKASGMENAACVVASDRLLADPGRSLSHSAQRTGIILHELAHMWFGDLVTMCWWDDLWLNEAFASWAGARAGQAVVTGSGPAGLYTAERKLAACDADYRPTSHPVRTDVTDTETALAAFDEISYEKGASVLGQLAARAGAPAWRRALRDYFTAHAWSNAGLRQLVEQVSEAAGEDLTGWARDWLETRGVNELRLRTASADGRYTSAWIEQTVSTGDPVLREHRLTVAVMDGEPASPRLRERTVLDVTVTGPRTPLAGLAGQPVAALLLPDEEDMTYAKLRLDERSWDTAITRGEALPREPQRAACLRIARDMVRDGELAPARFAALLARIAARQQDPLALLAWARLGYVTLARYDPGHCLDLLAPVADAYQSLAESADAAPRLRQAALEALAITAVDRGQLAALERFTRTGGTAAGRGRTQWLALTRLAALGQLSEAEIRTEAGSGQPPPSYLIPVAALADRAAKDRVWAEVFAPGRLPALVIIDVAAAFWQPQQSQLLAPYVPRYLDELPELAARHGWQEGRIRLQRMFPFVGWTPELIRRAADLARDEALPPMFRKVLREQIDDLHRARTVRQRWAVPARART